MKAKIWYNCFRRTDIASLALHAPLHDVTRSRSKTTFPFLTSSLLQQAERKCQNMDMVVLDPEVLQRTIQFYCSLSEWMVLQTSSSPSPQLPLPKEVPLQFAAIPEFFVESLADFILFCAK